MLLAQGERLGVGRVQGGPQAGGLRQAGGQVGRGGGRGGSRVLVVGLLARPRRGGGDGLQCVDGVGWELRGGRGWRGGASVEKTDAPGPSLLLLGLSSPCRTFHTHPPPLSTLTWLALAGEDDSGLGMWRDETRV